MIYLDSSAIVKLVMVEQESVALEEYVSGTAMVSSSLAATEVRRTVRRWAPDQLVVAETILGLIPLIAVGAEVLRIAESLEPTSLRTLDAILLASALLVRSQLDGFVAYDARLLEAARSAGLVTASPA